MMITLLVSMVLAGDQVCEGEHESPQCAAEQVAEATLNLSLPAIQAELDAGAQVYRAVFDAGSRGRPAVSFERRPSRSPELVIYGGGGRTLRREIGMNVWETVMERSRYVGRKLEPIDGYSISCLVSSDVVVQISRPRRRSPDQTSERAAMIAAFDGASLIEASQNSCGGGLTWDYGALLADIACEEIPECDAMGPRENYMLAVQHLEAVFQLRGDRLAAANLFTEKGWPPSRSGRDQPVESSSFANWLEPVYGATLDWLGSVIEAEYDPNDPAPHTISRFLAEQDGANRGLNFRPAEFGADSAEVGWVTGTVDYSVGANGTWRVHEAPYRQTWLRKGDRWRLWSMTVGAFEVRDPPTDHRERS